MKKLTVKEIVEHPELSQFIAIYNSLLFMKKRTDIGELANLYNQVSMNSGRKITDETPTEDMVRYSIQTMNDTLVQAGNKINEDKLMLYLGYVATRFLGYAKQIEEYRDTKASESIFFQNGDCLTVRGDAMSAKIFGQENVTIMDVKDRLARIILITAQQFNSNTQKSKNNLVEINGNYFYNIGSDQSERVKFNEKDLVDYARSADVIEALNGPSLAQAINERQITKSSILKHLGKGKLSKSWAIDFLEQGVISEDEFAKRVFKKQSLLEVFRDPEVDPYTKTRLFINKKVPESVFREVADFSLAFNAYIFKGISIEEFESLIREKGLEPSELSFVVDWDLAVTEYEDTRKRFNRNF